MAAGAWKAYRSTREKLGTGGINFSTGVFYLSLYTPATNAATETLSTKASVTNEIASGNGYSNSAMSLATTTWTSVATDTYRFDSSDWFVSANGGAIPSAGSNIQYGVIWQSGGLLVCYSTLSTSSFNVTATNRLTVQMNASGILELSGA